MIGTNLKMYKGVLETRRYISELGELLFDLPRENLEIFVIPSYTAILPAVDTASKSSIVLGAQNMFWEDSGQYTGEVSPIMVRETGAEIIEIGHSERREHFGETDFTVNKKVLAALGHDLRPLICIGETAREKEFGITAERLATQIKVALFNVDKEHLSNIIVAYEPVWAIGEQGVPASPCYANHQQQVIRETLIEMFSEQAYGIPVLYGGSVNSENAVSLISQPAIDGLFIGRAAWEAAEFDRLIRSILSTWTRKSDD